jgi:hypothetical protein
MNFYPGSERSEDKSFYSGLRERLAKSISPVPDVNLAADIKYTKSVDMALRPCYHNVEFLPKYNMMIDMRNKARVSFFYTYYYYYYPVKPLGVLTRT